VPIRALVFDLFDTVVDLDLARLPEVELGGRRIPSTAGALHAALPPHPAVGFEAFAHALRAVDREWRERAYGEGRELPTVERFGRLAAALGFEDPELPARLTDIHMGMIEALARTPSHHAALLARLRGRVRVGLCSNFSHSPTALSILESAGLRPHFDALVISHDVGLRKPRPEIFEAVLAGLGTRPEETVHVGDNLDADVGGAAAMGLRTVWITRRVADPEATLVRHGGARPDWVVRDLGEVEALLRAETDAG
jgi:HAD superfamily hydrolase (TIGR01509 family)